MSLSILIAIGGLLLAAVGTWDMASHLDSPSRPSQAADTAVIILGLLVAVSPAVFPSWPETAFGVLVP